MENTLTRLENQMKKLVADFQRTCEQNEELRRRNEQLLNELLEKTRRLEVVEERDSVLMETQAEKKRLEDQRERIRKEVLSLQKKIRALKGGQTK
jgi:peptidoglycan hydrolase CwlO-like protein